MYSRTASAVQEESADESVRIACETPHLQYLVAGRLHVVMDDGAEAEFGPGDVSLLPLGHDAWVVGNEPVIVIDVQGMADYAKSK